MLAPCQPLNNPTSGCTISNYASINPKLFDSNPIPSIPFAVAAKPAGTYVNGIPGDSGNPETFAVRAASDANVMEVYVEISDDVSPAYDMAGTGTVVLYR